MGGFWYQFTFWFSYWFFQGDRGPIMRVET